MASTPMQTTGTPSEFTPPRLDRADFFRKKRKVGVGSASVDCNSAPNRVLSAMFREVGAFNRVWNARFCENSAFNRVWNAMFLENTAFNRVWNALFSQNSAFNRV